MMNEKTPFNPESPYAVAKMAAFQTVQNYRKAYGIHAVNGILFNHESPNRGSDFVTRKITKYVAQYSRNAVEDNKPLQLGNLNAKRDWGDAREYIKAMQLMLNVAEGDKITDYVVATGDVNSVRTFVAQAFQKIGVYMEWIGEGAIEKGINKTNGRDILVEVNSEFYRPIDVGYLCGDSSLICKNLRWKPTVQLKQLISDMVEHDIQLLKG
jgi:GDPmannose 4,6-dehydratase